MNRIILSAALIVASAAVSGAASAATHHRHHHAAVTATPKAEPILGVNPMTIAPSVAGEPQGTNEAETILGPNPMTKATYPMSNMHVQRVAPILGVNPASGTP